ncbi:hypothetical protein ACFL3G_08620 [Planctomycetota bacterium]
MKLNRIKTEWASLRFTVDRQIIVCVKSTDTFKCIYFESREQLKRAIDRKKISVKNWTVSVLSNCCISKPLELPANDLSEAFKMAEFELGSLVPIPPETLIYGCSAVKSEGDLFRVLVHIVKTKVIEEILKEYKAIGIAPARVMVDSVVMDNQPEYKPEIIFYNDQAVCQIETLTCDAIVAEGLLKAAEKPDFQYLNFLPKKLLKKAHQRKLLINSAVTAILAILVIFSFWLNFAMTNWRIDRACKQIKAQIAPVEHIASSVESKRQRVKAIQKQLSNRDQISQILRELYKYSPRAISISQLQFTSRSGAANINIKGQANSLSNAFEYSDAMKNADLLSNIQIINAQQISRPGGSIVEFKADCLIRSR